MRYAALPLFALCLPAMAQTHLGVPAGNIVQLFFKQSPTDSAGNRSQMVQISNDGTTGSLFTIPSGKALVITDITMHSAVPYYYTGTNLNGRLSLYWVINHAPSAGELYSETFRASGASTYVTLNRSFTGGRIFASSTITTPGFYVDTPWDPYAYFTTVTATGYLVSYP